MADETTDGGGERRFWGLASFVWLDGVAWFCTTVFLAGLALVFAPQANNPFSPLVTVLIVVFAGLFAVTFRVLAIKSKLLHEAREAWRKSFDDASPVVASILQRAATFLPNKHEELKAATGLNNWREVYEKVAWPSTGAPLSDWRVGPSSSLDYWALELAHFLRLNGVNEDRIKLRDFLKAWIGWLRGYPREFGPEFAKATRQYGVLLRLYGYLEVNEAKEIVAAGSPPVDPPDYWATLPQSIPALNAPTPVASGILSE